ncbi:uncharacterized protein BX663DRAFT_491194 [Cokeromyces recurvatus]|uniref:uncharacterized protein n=1 Tax=Cokeromyces recurvatus TaxID=90255 RepID=UPI0022200C94|nr:uncharacterized protein BX663DRAFT_491194 [Cokeromyces recurvatus]KAI7907532.1 hypothetical protein BX663DRAFT_491194 [Cokeromyces recurvatus]
MLLSIYIYMFVFTSPVLLTTLYPFFLICFHIVNLKIFNKCLHNSIIGLLFMPFFKKINHLVNYKVFPTSYEPEQ